MTLPTEFIDLKDPGDDVIRRFRFQIGYAALKAIALSHPASIASCIYCEQFEDVLIELKDGYFIGTQIKTREIDQGPLKTTDEAIMVALVKFCREDRAFPGCFRKFCLVTNHSFFGGEGADNLQLLIDCARTNPQLNGLSSKSSFVKIVKKIGALAELTQAEVIATLAKLELEPMLTAIELDLEVVQALAEIDAYGNLRYVQLLKAASLLRDRIWSASSKAHQFNQTAASAVVLDIAARTLDLTVANKRLDHTLVRDCIIAAAAETATPEQERLAIRDYLPRDGAPAGLSRMQAKMSAGEVTAMELEQFKDDVRSLEATFLRWKEKHDLQQANARLQHIEQLVIQQCRQHNDPAKAPPGFSHPIISDRPGLKASLSTLAKNEAATLYGCRPEHLAGAVGMLTDECRVWWSEPFDLEAKA
jgi:hypothetical protein